MKVLFLIGSIVVAGCGVGAPSAGEEALFQVTSVRLDGERQTSKTELVTRQEWVAMFDPSEAVRSAGNGIGVSEQAITRDNPCTGSSVVLYDQVKTYCQLFGCNTICFSGSGSADLSTYCHISGMFGCSHWDGAVRSFQPDGNSGRLSTNDVCFQSFSGTTWTNTDTCGSSAWQVTIN